MTRDFQNLFNRDFFPTPLAVVEQMLADFNLEGKYVLDPSAGSGNILNYCAKHGAKTYACEINDTLRKSLKNHEVIGDDFLKVTEEQVSHIDIIAMNPPFSAEERHIKHAFDIAPNGCVIVSLCNAEMLNNQCYQSRREIKELIDNNGTWMSIGNAFHSSSERKTDTEIALIKLYKQREGENEFEGYFSMEEDEYDGDEEGLRSYNVVRDAVNRYVLAVQKFDNVMFASNEINELTSAIGGNNITFGATWKEHNKDTTITREIFKKNLQKQAWKWIFDKFDMKSCLTTDVYNEINKLVEKQSGIPFTMRNIYRMIEDIIGTQDSRMKNMALQIFDKICSHSADNITEVETWKTNSAHMLNRKFIIPYVFELNYYGTSISIRYEERQKLLDICKVLCYIVGQKYEESRFDLKTSRYFMWGEWYTWGFFKIKGHKKGTMHLEFRDERVWAMFNNKIAEMRGFQLPAKTKEKASKRTSKKPDEIGYIPKNRVTLKEAIALSRVGFNKATNSNYCKILNDLQYYEEVSEYNYNKPCLYERYSVPTYINVYKWMQEDKDYREKYTDFVSIKGNDTDGYVYTIGRRTRDAKIETIYEDDLIYDEYDDAVKAGVKSIIEKYFMN